MFAFDKKGCRYLYRVLFAMCQTSIAADDYRTPLESVKCQPSKPTIPEFEFRIRFRVYSCQSLNLNRSQHHENAAWTVKILTLNRTLRRLNVSNPLKWYIPNRVL